MTQIPIKNHHIPTQIYQQSLFQQQIAFQNMIQNIKSSSVILNYTNIHQQYSIKYLQIQSLNHQIIRQYYQNILQKYKTKKIKRSWCQNQLKLFVWVLLHFQQIIDIDIENFTTTQWLVIAKIFPNKQILDCKFKWFTILKQSNVTNWCNQQDQMLIDLLENNIQQNKWHQVAKMLFKQSEGKYFRKPKQCRQRWLNYLNPNISKAKWSKNEDIKLLQIILQYGKKWSKISKILKNRTQHAVKNRYNSLLKYYIKKRNKSKKSSKSKDIIQQQNKIYQQLIAAIQSTSDIQLKNNFSYISSQKNNQTTNLIDKQDNQYLVQSNQIIQSYLSINYQNPINFCKLEIQLVQVKQHNSNFVQNNQIDDECQNIFFFDEIGQQQLQRVNNDELLVRSRYSKSDEQDLKVLRQEQYW